MTLFDLDEPSATPETWTVPQLNEHLAAAIRDSVPNLLWVEGEITNLKRSNAGHVYFTLVEAGADHREAPCTLSVSLFQANREKVNLRLRRAGGSVRMEDGVRVRIRGSIELYVKRGQVQLKMIAIDPEFTLGDLAVRREALLRRLADEGLLEANRRRPLPPLPQRIGLVTSIGSAAHADFLHELESSGFGFEVTCVDARVQGLESESTVVAAIRTLTRRDVDVIALVRGGGARTDLVAFDSESIARAVATSPIPVWCGIGHEIDRAVVDEVAHTAWKTPTACAAALVDRVRAAQAGCLDRWEAVLDLTSIRLDRSQERLDQRRRRIANSTRNGLDRGDTHVTACRTRLQRESRHALEAASARLRSRSMSLSPTIERRLIAATHRLELVAAKADGVDPVRLLARGWSITTAPDGRPVRSVTQLAAGDELTTRLADGIVRSTISGTEVTIP